MACMPLARRSSAGRRDSSRGAPVAGEAAEGFGAFQHQTSWASWRRYSAKWARALFRARKVVPSSARSSEFEVIVELYLSLRALSLLLVYFFWVEAEGSEVVWGSGTDIR